MLKYHNKYKQKLAYLWQPNQNHSDINRLKSVFFLKQQHLQKNQSQFWLSDSSLLDEHTHFHITADVFFCCSSILILKSWTFHEISIILCSLHLSSSSFLPFLFLTHSPGPKKLVSGLPRQHLNSLYCRCTTLFHNVYNSRHLIYVVF